MRPGDIIRTSSLASYTYFNDGKMRSRADYSPPDGECIVVAVLGTEPKDGSDPLDVEAILRDAEVESEVES